MALRLKGAAPKQGAPDKRYYMLDVQEGYRRVRLSTGTRDRVAAERKEQAVLDALREDAEISEDALRELIRGKSRSSQMAVAKAKARQRTLKEAMDEALADRNFWAKLKSLETVRTNCKIVQSYLGENTPINDITQAAVDAMVTRMEAEKSAPATINRKLHALMAVLRREQKAGRLVAAVPEYRPNDERDNARQFTLTVEDEELILSRVLAWDSLPDPEYGGRPRTRDGQDYHDLFVFLADVGCRLSQAFNLKWSDLVTQPNPAVRFWRHAELKGGRPRTIPLTARAAAVLRRRKSAAGKEEDGPFSTLNKSRANKLWNRALKGTHLEREKECVIHALRHTCATRLLSATGNIKLVQEWLGHRDIRTTSETYAKVLAVQALAGMSALEQMRSAPYVRHPDDAAIAVTGEGDVPRQGLIANGGL
ncbi:tyrosine-type recombinase/integrase [Stenotrophomonas pavanii]|uniref:tyrosine-type recombinase/integrase n=1 Tax=Stenotrophomonas pavanii TaxID=487698 RepID=UPI004043493B